MARAKRGIVKTNRHKKVIKLTKGFRGRSKNCYTLAFNRLEKSLQHSYVGRKLKKRNYKSLFIQRINAACRKFDEKLSYSKFINMFRNSEYKNIFNLQTLSILCSENFNKFKVILNNIQNKKIITV